MGVCHRSRSSSIGAAAPAAPQTDTEDRMAEGPLLPPVHGHNTHARTHARVVVWRAQVNERGAGSRSTGWGGWWSGGTAYPLQNGNQVRVGRWLHGHAARQRPRTARDWMRMPCRAHSNGRDLALTVLPHTRTTDLHHRRLGWRQAALRWRWPGQLVREPQEEALSCCRRWPCGHDGSAALSRPLRPCANDFGGRVCVPGQACCCRQGRGGDRVVRAMEGASVTGDAV
jgi:hypothetical protein